MGCVCWGGGAVRGHSEKKGIATVTGVAVRTLHNNNSCSTARKPQQQESHRRKFTSLPSMLESPHPPSRTPPRAEPGEECWRLSDRSCIVFLLASRECRCVFIQINRMGIDVCHLFYHRRSSIMRRICGKFMC
jgi:hypothetical protein